MCEGLSSGSVLLVSGSHFTRSEATALLEGHGTAVITAPVSHPSSVKLVKRNLQLVVTQIPNWYYYR